MKGAMNRDKSLLLTVKLHTYSGWLVAFDAFLYTLSALSSSDGSVGGVT